MRTIIFGALLIVLFLSLRLPGLSLPYHQDEWKLVLASASAERAGLFFAHPPLTQLFFRLDRVLVGPEAMRFLPLVFSIASAWLLFVILRRRLGKRTALISLVLSSVIFYNVWASLQLDTDGAILPFFFLLALYFYDRWNSAPVEQSRRWLVLLAMALLLGLLVKLSFVLVISALALDFILMPSDTQSFQRRFVWATLGMVILGTLFVISLSITSFLYPFFDWRVMLAHASSYTAGGRNYLQILVQVLKAIFYLSPLLIVPLIFISRETVVRLRPFFLYIILGLVFYLGLFDFSRGALDKYLAYLIMPLVAISATTISQVLTAVNKRQIKIGLFVGGILALGLVFLNFLSHQVLPLYPKMEWFVRVWRGDWLILNPFTGGSGPAGFYVSFLFLVISFIITSALGSFGLIKRAGRPAMVAAILIIGLAYNIVMAEELLLGRLNGSLPQALQSAIVFLKSSPNIKSVITYNDVGAFELSKIGKYAGRFYATPQFEGAHKERFADHDKTSGYYLVVEMPLLYEGFYKNFFAQCRVVFETHSGAITSHIYHCQT